MDCDNKEIRSGGNSRFFASALTSSILLSPSIMTSRLYVLSGWFCPRTLSSIASQDAGLNGSDSISFKL